MSPALPRHSGATPVPTFAGGGRQAGGQGDDDGERGCQIPLCPCHGPAGATRLRTRPPGLSRHLCERATSARSHGTGRQCEGTLRTLLLAATRAGREQPARHRSQANGLGGLCSEPPSPRHTRPLCPEPASGEPGCPRCPPALRPRGEPAAPLRPVPPIPPRGRRQSCGSAGSSAPGRGQV